MACTKRNGKQSPSLDDTWFQVADLLLREGADVNQEGVSARSALHTAVLMERPDTVSYLVKNNASTEVRDFQVHTSFMIILV